MSAPSKINGKLIVEGLNDIAGLTLEEQASNPALPDLPLTGTVSTDVDTLTGTVDVDVSAITGTVDVGTQDLTGTVSTGVTDLTGTGSVGVTAMTGTVSVTAATNSVTGIGTLFTTELLEGQTIEIAGELHVVGRIYTDTTLDLSSNHVAGAAGVAYTLRQDSTAIVGAATSFDTELSPGDDIVINGAFRVVDVVTDATNISVTSVIPLASSGTGFAMTLRAPSTAVVGTGTSFTTELSATDIIKIGEELVEVQTVTDNTNLVLTSAHTATAEDVSCQLIQASTKVMGTGTLFTTELAVGDFLEIGIATLAVASITSDTDLDLGSIHPQIQSDLPATKHDNNVIGTTTAFTTEANVGELLLLNGNYHTISVINSDTDLEISTPTLAAVAGAATSAHSLTLTGVGTLFTTELSVGEVILVGAEIFTVATLPTDTSLTVAVPPATGVTGVTAYKAATGRGALWTRNDTPNTLVFTDDAGTDWDVAGNLIANIGTVDADTGSFVASTPGDTLSILGADGLTTEIAGDTLTLRNTLSVSLQAAYIGGNTITTSGGNAFDVSGSELFSISGTGNSSLSTAAGALNISTVTSGSIAIVSAEQVGITGTTGINLNSDTAVTGTLSVSGLTNSLGLVLPEQAATPWTAAAGSGALWVRDDAPSTLMYTDDAGTDWPVNGGSSLWTDQTTYIEPSSSRSIGSQSATFLSNALNLICLGFTSSVGTASNETSITISGGGLHNATALGSTIAGGLAHVASGDFSAVSGGSSNNVSGDYAAISGGANNAAAGDYSWVGGRNMQLGATADRTFAWGYSGSAEALAASDSFLVFPAGNTGSLGVNMAQPTYSVDAQGTTLYTATIGVGYIGSENITSRLAGMTVRHAQGTVGALTNSESGDTLGSYSFLGYAGGYEYGAQISAIATQNWGGTSWGTEMIVKVTDDGETDSATRLRLTNLGRLRVGDDTDPVARLAIDGGIATRISAVTNATVTATSEYSTMLVNATAAARVISLNDATTMEGRILVVKKVDGTINTVTVTPNAGTGDLIDGQTTYVLSAQYDSITFQAYNGDWWII